MISDVRRIQALQQVAARGTITAAAEALGYTPSAISQQLSALESELGVPVLERRGRNVVLTDAGCLLLAHGHEAIAALERAEAAVAELHGEPTGSLRIGALASVTASLLPIALRRLRAEHPHVDPEVVVYPLDQTLEELRLGSIDLAIDQKYEFVPHTAHDDVDRTVLLTEPMVLLSPASSPIRSVADAGHMDWVASPAGTACGESVRVITTRHGFTPRWRYETEDHGATVGLVGAGLAVAVVPSLALIHRPADVHVEVVPDAYRTISALTRPAAKTRPAITAMIDHMVEAAKEFAYDSLAA